MACPEGQYYCHDRCKCMPIPKGKKVRKDGELVNEVAPPTKKHERMVKHIKKAYAKKGGLSDEEKSIAYATAWKNYKKNESFEIDKSAHKKVQRQAKIRNLAKGNKNPNEKAAAERKLKGPKLAWEDFKQEIIEREDSPYEKASDKALDKKYGYGTSHDKGPKTGFGRASNRNTAAAVLKDIRRRKSKSTSETRADAAHKGWSATAKTSKDQTPEKKATRKKLADTPYKKLPKDEQEKDQVAADAVKKEYDKRKKK